MVFVQNSTKLLPKHNNEDEVEDRGTVIVQNSYMKIFWNQEQFFYKFSPAKQLMKCLKRRLKAPEFACITSIFEINSLKLKKSTMCENVRLSGDDSRNLRLVFEIKTAESE